MGCLGTGQHRGGEDLLQDLRYLLGVHGDKRTACWQGSLEPMCQRNKEKRPPKRNPQKKKTLPMQMCFHLQSKWAPSPQWADKGCHSHRFFCERWGVWEMPAGGKGLKAEGRQLFSLSCPPTFPFPLTIHYCHSVPPRSTPVLKSLLFKSWWAWKEWSQ